MRSTLFHSSLRTFLRCSTLHLTSLGGARLAIGTLNGREQVAPSAVARTVRRVELTEENVQRIFGMSMHDLFMELTKKLGYAIED